MTRFSTEPSSPTSTASALTGDSGTKLTCRSRTSSLGTSTRPAQALRPDSTAVVRPSRSSIAADPVAPFLIAARSSADGAVICIMPSTNSPEPEFGR